MYTCQVILSSYDDIVQAFVIPQKLFLDGTLLSDLSCGNLLFPGGCHA